jgi:hypothetical protein
MSGEQGEMLMFVLAETVLKLPQLLSKMHLKTDKEVHFHGIDGVHCGPDETDDGLAVYWCESKVHKSLDSALSEAFDGLRPFLLGPGSGEADKRRELALLDRYMDMNDPDLQKRILTFLNPHKKEFNTVSWRGLCLVGFDYEYPSKPNTKKAAELLADLKAQLPKWITAAQSRSKSRNLETFEIHVFFLPLGFCEDFRKCMSKSLEAVS